VRKNDVAKNKPRGEWAELCFMARAAGRGLNVSQPHGDSAGYDVGVEQNGRFLRIQVKSTICQRRGGYTCNITGSKNQRSALSLSLTPRKGHKFGQYMEGWNLLRGNRRRRRTQES